MRSRILVKLSVKRLTEFKEFQLSSNMKDSDRRSRSPIDYAPYNSDNKILQLERKLGMHKEEGPIVEE